MARGRKRKHDPSIPKHIDQTRLPAGIYWGNTGRGRWYVRESVPDARPVKVTVAGPTATLSELHGIAESRAGHDAKGTVAYVLSEFNASAEAKALSKDTQENNAGYLRGIRSFKLANGLILGEMIVDKIPVHVMQRIHEKITQGTKESRPGAGDGVRGMPSKANHWKRYMHRAFKWAIRFGLCKTNPCAGVKQGKERGKITMPSRDNFATVLAFARERGERLAHTEGSVAPYVWAIMVIAHAARVRGIEVVTMTDANDHGEHLFVKRRKGSLDGLVTWSPELREAWSALQAIRAQAYKRNDITPPARPEDRPLIVNESGLRLPKSTFDSAWQRFIKRAIKEGVIAADDRFALHGLKHRGITDSDDPDSGGHKTQRMKQHYNHAIAVFPAAPMPQLSPELSPVTKKGAE